MICFFNYTALHLAASRGHSKSVFLLLSSDKIDINSKTILK